MINLKIEKRNNYYDQDEFLRSHDIPFTIGNNTFQEVVCHSERLGGNDEVSNLFFYYFKFVQILKVFFFSFSGALNLSNEVKVF